MIPSRFKNLALWTLVCFAGTTLLVFAIFVAAAKYYAAGSGQAHLNESSVFVESREPHSLVLLDHGAISLARRLHLIGRATKSIELEFFIYNVDLASRLITRALILKAREGVTVRILVDFATPIFQLKPDYAKYLKSRGIEVKYYNTTPLYRIFSAQHRSHRKLLIVDGKTVLTGGRNIGDDYFDLSPHYNFLDSDVEVTGPIAEAARASFDIYWNSPQATTPDTEKLASNPDAIERIASFFRTSDDINRIELELHKIHKAHSLDGLKRYTCNDMIFVTDFPEKGEGNRRVFAMIAKLLGQAKKEVWVETPYFVIKDEGFELLKQIRDSGTRLNVLTNGLGSTDAFYTVAALYPRLGSLHSTGTRLFAFKGAPAQDRILLPLPQSEHWGIHAKRAVVDDDTVLIGTYNVDPRSANLNSELMVVCRGNREFATAVLSSMQARANNSAQVTGGTEPMARNILLDGAPLKKRALFFISMPFAWLFDFLL